jgi:guanylate kinase
MKVVIINYSGNVGKSTIATNLLASRMSNPSMQAVTRKLRKL